MTPCNIAGMGILNGLNVMALTDHNTCKNCPAFFKAAKRQGIVPIAGMELTTAEDIHVACFFPCLESALEFDLFIEKNRALIKNKVEIFGEQIIMNENDEITGYEENLLPNATTVSIDNVYGIVKSYGGTAFPAHVDRQSNSIIEILGTFPSELPFKAAEFHDSAKIEEYSKNYPALSDKTKIISSDAHYLWNISEKENYFLLEDEPYSGKLISENLLKTIEGGAGL